MPEIYTEDPAIQTNKHFALTVRHLMASFLYTSTEHTTNRMPFEILFVMLIRAVVCAFALGIQCLYKNEKTVKYSGSCIQLT